MSLQPILAESALVQFHILAALVAVALAPLQLWRGRRGAWHRRLGYAWTGAMATLALTALAIPSHGMALAGGFGPLHLLVPVTLGGLWQAVAAARRREIDLHRRIMRQLAFGALGVAGIFTLMPHRTLGRALFGGDAALAWGVIALGGAALAAALAVDLMRDRKSVV